MKVISGKMRGMNLNTDLDRFTRPTEGKIKEAIFSVIFQVKPNSKALDLFAGSGAVGIEFISLIFYDSCYIGIVIHRQRF